MIGGSTPRLEGRGLVVRRDGVAVLDGVSLRVAAGELVTISGPSGSGKSTLLRALATLVPITAGSVWLDGEDSAAIAPQSFRTRVAYVGQESVMLDGSVADNLAYGPALRGVKLADDALTSLLTRVGIAASFLSREARDLSGGERQRIALARSLANDPSALLVDEPTSALDPEAATRVIAILRACAEAGCSVVAVTHVREHGDALGGTSYVCESGVLTRAETR